MQRRSLIFVVISVLVVALVYSPAATTFYVFAVPPESGFLNSNNCNIPYPLKSGDRVSCCWLEHDIKLGVAKCQVCKWTKGVGYSDCSNPTTHLEQPPTPPPPSGPAAPLQDGGVLQQPPSEGVAPPPTRGQGVLPEDGVLQQPPADEGTGAAQRTVEPPSTADEATPCPEGQVLDEETNLCVLEEQEEVEEPTTEEDQPSEESDSEEDNSNN